jgi:hypothetical protein
MEHENSSAFLFDSSYTRTNNIIFNPSYKTLEITCLVLQVATWTESYTDLIGKMLGPSSIGDGGLLGLLL